MAQVKCNIELFRASARDLTIVCYWGYTKLRTHLELYLNHLLTRLAWVSLLDFLSLHFITCKSNNSQLHEVFLRILYDNMLTSMVLWIISNSSPLSVPTSSPLWVGKSSHLCISRLYFPVSLILGLPMWLFFFFFLTNGMWVKVSSIRYQRNPLWEFPTSVTRRICPPHTPVGLDLRMNIHGAYLSQTCITLSVWINAHCVPLGFWLLCYTATGDKYKTVLAYGLWIHISQVMHSNRTCESLQYTHCSKATPI